MQFSSEKYSNFTKIRSMDIKNREKTDILQKVNKVEIGRRQKY